jgi:transglutaminase-like putative cysteine protease
VADQHAPLSADARRWCMAAAGACLLTLLTQVETTLALGIGGVAALCMTSSKPWPTAARLLLLAVLGVVVLLFHDFAIDRAAGTSGLAALLAIKPLETRRLRDAHSLLGFSVFAPFAAFLQDQGPLVLALGTLDVLLLVMALATLVENRNELASAERLPRGRRLRDAGHALLVALPLTLACFWLFPRLSTPLWDTPERAGGRSGLRDAMKPDQWVDLFADDTPALRVKFHDREPRQRDLYWRAHVLWDFDGGAWSSGGEGVPLGRPQVRADAGAILYDVVLEPTDRSYLVTLDLPLAAPVGATLRGDLTVQRDDPVMSLVEYTLTSDPTAVHQEDLPAVLRHRALSLPPERNPRTRALAETWRREVGGDDRELVRRALRLIEADFSYSLTVPPTGRHPVDEFLFESRVGFCQHFSSAFAALMRAAGVPTRVVIGYHGGVRNRYGGYWIVRAMDAHAWNEVWLRGRGWVRVDPTAAVAPERVLDTVADLAREESLLPETFNPLLEIGDWFRRGWNDLVLGFDAKRQAQLLRSFGVSRATSRQLGVVFAVGAGLALALTLWLQMRGRPPRYEPLVRAWRAFVRRMRRAGLDKPAAEAATTFGERAAELLPAQAPQLRSLVERYVAWRYAGREPTFEDKALLIAELRAFRPGRPAKS